MYLDRGVDRPLVQPTVPDRADKYGHRVQRNITTIIMYSLRVGRIYMKTRCL